MNRKTDKEEEKEERRRRRKRERGNGRLGAAESLKLALTLRVVTT